MSRPLSVCREHALIIVQDLPQKLIGNDTLSKVCKRCVESRLNIFNHL